MNPTAFLDRLNPTLSSIGAGVKDDNFKTIAAEIDGALTNFVWAHFADCWLLVCTQREKIGSLVKVSRLESASGSSQLVYEVTPLLGAQDLETQAAARYLAERLNLTETVYLFCNLSSPAGGFADAVKAVGDVFADVLNIA